MQNVLGPDRLASGSEDKTIKVWEVATARCVATSNHSKRTVAVAMGAKSSAIGAA